MTGERTTPRPRRVRQATPPRTMDIEPVDRARELPVLGGWLARVTGSPLTRNDLRFDPARCMDAVAVAQVWVNGAGLP